MKYILFATLSLFISQVSLGQDQTVGVTIYDKESTSDGYVFFSPRTFTDAYLIDNCGFLIKSWERGNFPGLSGYMTETGLMLRANKVDSPKFGQASTGGNLELVDWNDNTVWSSDFNTQEYIQHHDAVLMPNGNIIYIGWERISPDQQLAYGRRSGSISYPNLWGEFVQEIKPIGSSNYEVVWEWHLQDHFIQDSNSSLSTFGVVKNEIGKVDINYLGYGAWDDDDWWHCNALDYNEELDQILINSRNNNELWIIDHSTTTQEAKGNSGGNSGKGGELLYRWGNPKAYDRGNYSNLRMFGSHATYWIPKGMPNEGKIMYFNNGEDRPQGYYSTVEMIDPIFENGQYQKNINNHYYPLEPEVVYQAQNPFEFVSIHLSNAQQLYNGHVFINEGGGGRLFEIDNNGNIVWEYINPVGNNGPISQGSTILGNSIFRAYKYPLDHPSFDGLALDSGELLEGDSEFNQCLSVETEDLIFLEGIDIQYDINGNRLSIYNPKRVKLNLKVISNDGQLIFQNDFSDNDIQITLDRLIQGIYIINLSSEKSKKIISKKIVRF